MKIFFVTFILLTGSFLNLTAQTKGSASIGATITEPIIQTKSVEINFGIVAVIIAGEVGFMPVGKAPENPNIVLPFITGIFTAASFFNEGSSAHAFTIGVPSSPLEIKSGANNLVVNSFSSDPIVRSESGLVAGVFVSVTPFNVTVNYN